MEGFAPEAPASGSGTVSQSWGFELSNESGLMFWVCSNQGECNPRAMDGRTITGGMTKTNTEVRWEPYGQMFSQCRCIVDGKTYEGVVDSEIKTIFTHTEHQQACSCTYPCNTGFGDKIPVWFWEDPEYAGVSTKTFLQPDYCCKWSLWRCGRMLNVYDRRSQRRCLGRILERYLRLGRRADHIHCSQSRG